LVPLNPRIAESNFRYTWDGIRNSDTVARLSIEEVAPDGG